MVDVLRPLDEVHIHGVLILPPQPYDTIMAEATRGSSRSKNSRKMFHFLSGHSIQDGANTVHLDLMRRSSRRRLPAGHIALSVDLAQEWFPSTRVKGVPPTSQSAKDGPRIEALLNILKDQASPATLTCHVDWVYRDDEADSVIPIPFPMTWATNIGMSNVRGLRIANDDNSQTASFG